MNHTTQKIKARISNLLVKIAIELAIAWLTEDNNLEPITVIVGLIRVLIRASTKRL